MGLLENNIKEEEFEGKIYTLTCEETGRKLCNILVKKDNSQLPQPVFMEVEATSPFGHNSSSGKHLIGGILTYGPVDKTESPRFPTRIKDVKFTTGEVDCATIIVEEAT